MSKLETYEALETYSNNGSQSIEQIFSELTSWDPNICEELSGHSSDIWCVRSTSNNSHIFSAGADHLIIVWDGVTNQEISRLHGHSSTVSVLELTQNDEILISASWNGEIFKWNWKSSSKVAEFEGCKSGVYCSIIFEDYLITGSGDSIARLWRISDCVQVASCRAGNGGIFSMAFFWDKVDYLVTGDFDECLNLCQIQEKSSLIFIQSISLNLGSIKALAATPDSKHLIVGTVQSLILLLSLPKFKISMTFTNHSDPIVSILVSKNSKYFISTSEDRSVKIFSIKSLSEQFSYNQEETHIYALHISDDESYIYTGGSSKVLKKRKFLSSNKCKSIKAHEKSIVCMALSPDPNIAITGSQDGKVKVWDLKCMREISSVDSGITWSLCVSPDMKFVISAGDDSLVKVWDYYRMALVTQLDSHSSSVLTVCCSPDSSKLSSAGKGSKLIVHSLEGFETLHVFDGHTEGIFACKFLNDFELVSGSSDYTLRFWSLVSGSQKFKLDNKTGMIQSIEVSKDSAYLYVGDSGGFISFWDLKKQIKVDELKLHRRRVQSLNLSSDGTLLVSSGTDNRTLVINLEEKNVESILKIHHGPVRSAGITNDMKFVISASEDSTIKIWDRTENSSTGINSVGSDFDQFFFLANLYKGTCPHHKQFMMTVSNFRLTYGHLYCYKGNHQMLELALNHGLDLRKDSLGNSPLIYALNRRAQSAVDVIITFLVNLQDFRKFLRLAWNIRSDFESLLRNRSSFLPDFMEKVFYISNQPQLIKYGIPIKKLPILIYEAENSIEVGKFVDKNIHDRSKEVLIEFRILPFPVSAVSGSEASIQMLKNILNNENREIMRSKVVTMIIKSKWDNFFYFILGLSIVYWLNIVVMVVLLVKATEDNNKHILYGLINLALFLYEIAQIYAIGIREYINFWNIIDQIRIILNFIWIALDVSIGENRVILISYIMVIFNFIRGLSGFRIFSITRFYTTLIIRSFIDVLPFLLIFFYSTLFFGTLSWTSSSSRGNAFIDLWKKSFELNMGNFDDLSELNLEYLTFILACVINVIVILNLLISILGDSYEHFQSQAIELANLEMLDVVLEIETLMIWKRDLNHKSYIQACQNATFENISKDWEGKIKAMHHSLKTEAKTLNSYLEYISAKLDIIDFHIN